MPLIYKTIKNIKIGEMFDTDMLQEMNERILDAQPGEPRMKLRTVSILDFEMIGERLFTIDNREDCLLVCADLGNGLNKLLSKIEGDYLNIKTFKQLIGDINTEVSYENTLLSMGNHPTLNGK